MFGSYFIESSNKNIMYSWNIPETGFMHFMQAPMLYIHTMDFRHVKQNVSKS